MLNNKYTIKVEAPLLRLGLSIETEVSEKYVGPVLHTIMAKVRLFNKVENREQDDHE